MPAAQIVVSIMLAATLGLASAGVPWVVAAPEAQPQDPVVLLEASARALEGVRSFRIRGELLARIAAEGSAMTFETSMSGEFVAPDRVRIAMNLGLLGLDLETIVVGEQVWMRTGQGFWDTMSLDSMGALGPNGARSPFAGSTADLTRYLLRSQVTEQGGTYRVTGELDIGTAVAELGQIPGVAGTDAMRGIDPATAFPDLRGTTATLVYVIDRTTLYPVSMELTMAVPMASTLEMMGMDGGADMSFTIRLTYSGFDDPDIRIAPPL